MVVKLMVVLAMKCYERYESGGNEREDESGRCGAKFVLDDVQTKRYCIYVSFLLSQPTTLIECGIVQATETAKKT